MKKLQDINADVAISTMPVGPILALRVVNQYEAYNVK